MQNSRDFIVVIGNTKLTLSSLFYIPVQRFEEEKILCS